MNKKNELIFVRTLVKVLQFFAIIFAIYVFLLFCGVFDEDINFEYVPVTKTITKKFIQPNNGFDNHYIVFKDHTYIKVNYGTYICYDIDDKMNVMHLYINNEKMTDHNRYGNNIIKLR